MGMVRIIRDVIDGLLVNDQTVRARGAIAAVIMTVEQIFARPRVPGDGAVSSDGGELSSDSSDSGSSD